MYDLRELSAEVDAEYDCVDLKPCEDVGCKSLLTHELRWTSTRSTTPSSQAKSIETRETGQESDLTDSSGFPSHLKTTIQLLGTMHHTSAETPRRLSTMKRDFTAQRLHDILQETTMPICEHKSLGNDPVLGKFHVDFMSLRSGKYVYRTTKVKCFYHYWESAECHYGGMKTMVGFEAKTGDRPKSEGRDCKSIVLNAIITRDVGVLCPSGTSSVESSEESLSRSSSWEFHAVTLGKLQRFKASWDKWVGRVKLVNEECRMRRLLEQLSRLATLMGD
jgi:hypothetical protein